MIVGGTRFRKEEAKMIDAEKWEKASDEARMQAIKTIREVMNPNAVTKADNAIITDYLLNKVDNKED